MCTVVGLFSATEKRGGRVKRQYVDYFYAMLPVATGQLIETR